MRRFLGIWAALIFMVSGFAFAQTKPMPNTPITQIDFEGGKLVQEDMSQNLWVEYDFRGTRRYEFQETLYNPDLLVLKGRKGDVTLVIDMPAKTISGEWPGHSMSKLYDITNVTYLNSTQPPREEQVIPNYVPPGKKAPIAPPKKEILQPEIPLSPASLTVASYTGGSFYSVENDEWREESREGQIFRFKNIGSDERSVFLYDAGRQILIELDVADKMSRISHSGEKLQDLYPLTDLRNETTTVSSPQNPQTLSTPLPNSEGRLSAKDRSACLAKGGFVERAGILGAERCTMRYSDGGNICIDSSNCEGKCLATVEAAQNNAVSGLCQATDNPFGCYAEVVAGSTGPALCVD